jgi:aryl sulfotransferase
MVKITWLASYPKSGNTWMRALLTNYGRNKTTPASINELDGGPIASARVWFDEWVGIEASLLDDITIERLRPQVYRCLAAEAKEPLVMKVHDAWGCSDEGQALFPADVTAGVVYIVRNPLDLAASCAHHWGIELEAAVAKLCDPEAVISRSLGGLSDQLMQRLGSWGDHVHSWVDESGLPVMVVRYEDLRRQPEAVFADVLRFCGQPVDEERIRQAVAFSDFDELQRQEKAEGFRERSQRASAPFFRRGEVGSWRQELSPDLAQRLIAAHAPTMRRLKYLDDRDQPQEL